MPTTTTDQAERDLAAFGRLVRAARTEAGMSQAQLAAALGLKQASISAWESGESEPRDRDSVFRAEQLLGLSHGTLAGPLGYGPPVRLTAGGRVSKKTGRSKSVNTREAILLDPKLSKQAKEALLSTYRALISPSRCTEGLARHDPIPARSAA